MKRTRRSFKTKESFHTCSSYKSETRIWIPNTNYNNTMNWLDHKLPCESSNIIFPEDLNTAIYLPEVVQISEINLPNDGELIFTTNGHIEISNKDETYENCNLKDLTFRKINIESWLNPSNWKTVSNTINNIAIPHSERVPCLYDNVIFPNESSFWIQFPDVPISVNSFSIEGRNLTNFELQDYLMSEPGSRQFRHLDYQERTNVLSIEPITCTDKSGCLCHRNNFIIDVICKNLRPICTASHCLNPIKPVGHCCDICGGYLLLKFNKNNFNLNKFTILTKQRLYYYNYFSINVHISKVLIKGDTHIQIVIIEKDFKYKGDSVSAAEYLHNLFQSDLKEYNLLSSELYISGPEYIPGQRVKATIITIFGTLLIVLISLSIIFYMYGSNSEKKFSFPFNIPNLRNFRPFIFVRFENTGDTEGGLEFRNRSVASSLFNMDHAFDNPMYNENPIPGPSTNDNLNHEVPLSTNQFEYKNPLFSDLQKNDLEIEE